MPKRRASFRVVPVAEARARIDAALSIELTPSSSRSPPEDPTITHDKSDLMGAVFNSAWVVVKPTRLEPHSPQEADPTDTTNATQFVASSGTQRTDR